MNQLPCSRDVRAFTLQFSQNWNVNFVIVRMVGSSASMMMPNPIGAHPQSCFCWTAPLLCYSKYWNVDTGTWKFVKTTDQLKPIPLSLYLNLFTDWSKGKMSEVAQLWSQFPPLHSMFEAITRGEFGWSSGRVFFDALFFFKYDLFSLMSWYILFFLFSSPKCSLLHLGSNPKYGIKFKDILLQVQKIIF